MSKGSWEEYLEANPIVRSRIRRDARQPLPVGQLNEADARALAMAVRPDEDVDAAVRGFKDRDSLRDWFVRPGSFRALHTNGRNVPDLYKRLKEPGAGQSRWKCDNVLKTWVEMRGTNQPSAASKPLPAPAPPWPSASSSSSSGPPAPAAAALAAASSSSEYACVVVAERPLQTPCEQAIQDSIRDHPVVALPWGNQFATQARSEPETEPPTDPNGAWGPGAWNRNDGGWSQRGRR